MIVIVKLVWHHPAHLPRMNRNLVRIPRWNHHLIDPEARAGRAMGFKVVPEVLVEHRTTNKRQEAATRLKRYKSSLLKKRRIAKMTARWSKPLGIGYRALQSTLQGRQISEIVRHSQALSAALEIAGSSTTVYVDGCVGALTVNQAGLSEDRLRVL